MKRVFLVDTENVNLKSLTGAHSLTEEDVIILFITNRTENGNFSRNKVAMINSKAMIKTIKVLTGGKNSLDFQLVSYLGLLIGYNADKVECDYYIISNDQGFYSSINLLSNCSNHNLQLIPNLQVIFDELGGKSQEIALRDLEDEVIVELKSFGYTDKTVEKAIIAIDTAQTKEEIEINFFFMFGWNTKIFQICKPIIESFYSKIA